MGGEGSGRWRKHEKMDTVDECLCLDLTALKKAGVLRRQTASGTITWQSAYSDKPPLVLRFICTRIAPTMVIHLLLPTDEPDTLPLPLSYIPCSRTRPHFGGVRWWLTCPMQREGQRCGRRVRRLFLPAGHHEFGCRKCHALTYRSAQAHDSRINALFKLATEDIEKEIERHPHIGLKAALRFI